MTIVLGIVLAVLGVALWVFAGLLPVARILRGDNKGVVTLGLLVTWMGNLTLSTRRIDGVRGARLTPDPDAPHKSKMELKVNSEWQELDVRFTHDADAKVQFIALLRHYLKEGGPPVLALPLRGRMNMMKRFLAFFPLGTVSIFAGILFIVGLAG